jgi:hypothetical protein
MIEKIVVYIGQQVTYLSKALQRKCAPLVYKLWSLKNAMKIHVGVILIIDTAL